MSEPAPAAVERAGEAGSFEAGRVATIAGGHAVHDTYTAFLPPLLPRIIEKLSLSNTAAGLLSAFLQLPGLLQPVIGHLADRTTLRWIVILAPGTTATLMSALGWAPGFVVLAGLLLMAGLSVAAFHATAPVAVGYLSGRRLGRGMGFWMVGGELGRTVGPLVVVSALAIMSFRSLAVLAVAGMATSALLFVRLRRVPLRTRDEGEPTPWRAAVRAMRRVMARLAALMALRSLMMMSVTVFLPVFLTDEGTTAWLAGAALSIVEGAGVIGALAGGWVSDRVGRRAVLAFGHVVAPAALLLLLLADGWLRLATLPLIGVSFLTATPVLMAFVQEQFPTTRALANGVFLSLNFVIRSIAAVVYGAFGDAFGLPATMVVAAVAMAGALPIVWLLPGDVDPGP